LGTGAVRPAELLCSEFSGTHFEEC